MYHIDLQNCSPPQTQEKGCPLPKGRKYLGPSFWVFVGLREETWHQSMTISLGFCY